MWIAGVVGMGLGMLTMVLSSLTEKKPRVQGIGLCLGILMFVISAHLLEKS